MKLIIYNGEYWIKNDIELPSNFDSVNGGEKKHYIFRNKLLHREEGPAVISSNETQTWYLNGKRHRIDGPAYINSSGYQIWYLNDIQVDGEIYQKIQSSSKEELLVYLVDSNYSGYLPLIEYQLKKE